jgi:hypothetical protein
VFVGVVVGVAVGVTQGSWYWNATALEGHPDSKFVTITLRDPPAAG